MQGKQHVTQAWCRQQATWNPLGGYRCALGGHSGATLPRSMPCIGVQIQGKREENYEYQLNSSLTVWAWLTCFLACMSEFDLVYLLHVSYVRV